MRFVDSLMYVFFGSDMLLVCDGVFAEWKVSSSIRSCL